MDDREKRVHYSHCFQGEYEDTCKYGETNCPAKPKKPSRYETKQFNISVSDAKKLCALIEYQKTWNSKFNPKIYDELKNWLNGEKTWNV